MNINPAILVAAVVGATTAWVIVAFKCKTTKQIKLKAQEEAQDGLTAWMKHRVKHWHSSQAISKLIEEWRDQ